MKRIIILIVFVFSSLYVTSNDKKALETPRNLLSKYGISDSFLITHARMSAIKTFYENSIVEKINYTQSVAVNKDYILTTVSYKTNLGDSFYSIFTNIKTLKKVIIDCTGNCDCRERVSVDTAGNITYECTCSSCSMSIEHQS